MRAQRIKNLTRQLSLLDCDALIISSRANIAYLTAFKESALSASKEAQGLLLVDSRAKLTYFTNFLYKEAAQAGLKDCSLLVSGKDKNIFSLIAEKAKKSKYKRVGFETGAISFSRYKALSGLFKKQGVELVAARNLVEESRMIKDKGELSLIKKSGQISLEAFSFIKEAFDPKMTEKDLSIEIERFLRLKADNDLAFNPIVAAGKNSVFPHHPAEDTAIGAKNLLIDLGSRYYGYCADLTRVFFWGKMPFLFRKILGIVKKAQELGIKKIKDGVKASAVDKAARDFIDKKGFGKYFGHGLGHGIGLNVHELPVLGPKSDEILKQGMVVTVEPAVYLKNKFGIRIEDMVLVKKNKGEILNGNFNRDDKAFYGDYL